jgi:ABC-type spermidine/putrescine transport system permease subunit I
LANSEGQLTVPMSKRRKATDPMQGAVRLAAVPAMLVLIGLVAAPLLLLIVQSFTSDSGFPSLRNLHHLCRTDLYLRVLGRTISFALEVTLVTLALGWPAAWALARYVPARHQPMILAALIVPFLTSYLLLIYGMLVLLAPGGPVAALGKPFGLGVAFGSILYSPAATFIMLVNENMSFVVIILYVAAQSVRDDLIDATRSLGGGRWAAFQHVIWPSAVPSLRTAFLLTFVPTAGIFAEPQILGGPRDQLLGNVIDDEMSLIGDLGFSAALALMLLVAIAFVAALVLAAPPLLAWAGHRARRLSL